MKRLLHVVFLALACASTACAVQDHQVAGELLVSVPWVRATPPGAPVAGGFLTVQNRGTADDRLLSVQTTAAQRVEIHEMRHVDGVARMRELDQGLVLTAGQTVVLAPGGYHLMFIQPLQPLVAGGRVEATLVFEKAGPVEVSFEVRAPGARSGHEAAPHH